MQSHLLNLFQPAHKIVLVGQSLNSDLKAIKFMHPYIIDTSLIFDHSRGGIYRPSLKWLATKHLKREIQRGQHKKKAGHDSIEDALACIDLVKLKLEKGLAFGGKGRLHAKVMTVEPEEWPRWDDNEDYSILSAQTSRRSSRKKRKSPVSKQTNGKWKYYVGGIIFFLFYLFKN